jgi:hypothetical protein
LHIVVLAITLMFVVSASKMTCMSFEVVVKLSTTAMFGMSHSCTGWKHSAIETFCNLWCEIWKCSCIEKAPRAVVKTPPLTHDRRVYLHLAMAKTTLATGLKYSQESFA